MNPEIHNESVWTKAIHHPILLTFTLFLHVFQTIIDWFFSPVPPPPINPESPVCGKRIAVIGAGLTGVSSASHCVGHGFEVTIFEARCRENGLGGVWSVQTTHLLFRQAIANNQIEGKPFFGCADPRLALSLPPCSTL